MRVTSSDPQIGVRSVGAALVHAIGDLFDITRKGEPTAISADSEVLQDIQTLRDMPLVMLKDFGFVVRSDYSCDCDWAHHWTMACRARSRSG